jgi:SWI/SNF-related matrix-associated actin-dependent regulator of chromatin subfamily A-like protein 1
MKNQNSGKSFLQLYSFQKEGVRFLKANARALLAFDMGTGKTATSIVAAAEQNLQNVLVICPASVKYNWAKELKKWYTTCPYIQVIEGRGAKINPTPGWTIINYDLLATKKIFLQLINKHYDILILDEAHFLKNNRAKRTKCVYFPRGLKDRADRVWLLTGTPVLNRPVELYSHLKSLAPERLGHYTSYLDYCKRYCAARENRWGWDVSGASNLEELSKVLDGFMLRRMKEDVLTELPDKIFQTIYLTATDKIKKLVIKERGEYEKESILGALATCRRASGLAKVHLVVAHLENVLENKQKAVVFAYHRDVISAIMESCRAYKPVAITGNTPARKRQEAVEAFKMDPECRIFVGQIEAAGTGIDGLQDVCDTVLFAELSWVPGQMRQAIDRCHRIGQKNAVLVQFLVVAGSIDEEMARALGEKEKVIDKIVKRTRLEETVEEIMGRIAKVMGVLCGSH